MTYLSIIIGLLCSLLANDGPYIQKYDNLVCSTTEIGPCCRFTYVIDRFRSIEDDKNALRGVETWCMVEMCEWTLEGYGYE